MKKYKNPIFKSVITNIINIILIIIIIFLIRKIPSKAQSIKELSNQQVAAQEKTDLEVLNADLQNEKDKIQTLNSLFASEKEILPVIEALSNLKNSGFIEEFNIADNPIKDKSGQLGLPLYIKGSGTRETIDITLKQFHSMGKIIKPEKINLKIEENITFEYTGFLLMQ